MSCDFVFLIFSKTIINYRQIFKSQNLEATIAVILLRKKGIKGFEKKSVCGNLRGSLMRLKSLEIFLLTSQKDVTQAQNESSNVVVYYVSIIII
jgi:hypothetical protein